MNHHNQRHRKIVTAAISAATSAARWRCGVCYQIAGQISAMAAARHRLNMAGVLAAMAYQASWAAFGCRGVIIISVGGETE